MLVLARKEGERIAIGEAVTLTVLEIKGSRVKLGFSGPSDVPIRREEVALQADWNAAPDYADACKDSSESAAPY